MVLLLRHVSRLFYTFIRQSCAKVIKMTYFCVSFEEYLENNSPLNPPRGTFGGCRRQTLVEYYRFL
jgi:hypothetical protein